MNTFDIRFDEPLYSVAEAARVIDVPVSTLSAWTRGYVRKGANSHRVIGQAVVTAFVPNGSSPTISFIGLAEGMVLAAVRRSGVSMQRVRPALAALERELGIHHALASQKLYTDGAELLFDFSPDQIERDVVTSLVVVRNGQRVFVEAVREQLQRIQFGPDGYAALLRVPGYQSEVVCDPKRSFGRPIFVRGGTRVDDVLSRFQAGESIDELTEEFGVSVADIEDALRVASRRAA
jgi:uncharacterized protein (DUF433 family)